MNLFGLKNLDYLINCKLNISLKNYINYIYIFLKNFISKLSKYINFNKYIINLKKKSKTILL